MISYINGQERKTYSETHLFVFSISWLCWSWWWQVWMPNKTDKAGALNTPIMQDPEASIPTAFRTVRYCLFMRDHMAKPGFLFPSELDGGMSAGLIVAVEHLKTNTKTNIIPSGLFRLWCQDKCHNFLFWKIQLFSYVWHWTEEDCPEVWFYKSNSPARTKDAKTDLPENLHASPLMLLETCVNTPMYYSVFHNLHTHVARCSASCVNGALRSRCTDRVHSLHVVHLETRHPPEEETSRLSCCWAGRCWELCLVLPSDENWHEPCTASLW